MTSPAPLQNDQAVLLRESQVATMLSIAPRTLRLWVSAGKFPRPIRVGSDQQRSTVRWLRGEVDAWIRSHADAR